MLCRHRYSADPVLAELLKFEAFIRFGVELCSIKLPVYGE